MNWYLQSGNEGDVATSSRIRFARNIQGLPFKLNKEQRIILENKIKDQVYQIGYGLQFFKLKDMDDITKMSLVEKNLVSPELVLKQNETASLLVNEEENICIMVGEEDHLRIQVFSPGLDLKNALNLAKEVDEKIGEALGYSINQKYGYLTSCPSNVGTGLRASIMVHLPALSKTQNVKKVFDTITNFGINIRGIYGENSQSSADMFQISNKRTLGITEEEIVQNLQIVAQQIIKQEREARKFLTKDSIELEDKIFRSYGILTNCKKISSQEASALLSNVKLGTDLGILEGMTDVKIKKMFLYTKPANLQKFYGEEYESIERDIKRAEIIKKILEMEN